MKGKVNFSPGPSRVYPLIPSLVTSAYRKGYLSTHHRSRPFMELARETKKVLSRNLETPDDYRWVFLSSATECWQTIAHSLVLEECQHHYCGDFGARWAASTRKLGKKAGPAPFDHTRPLDPDRVSRSADCVCVTANETSNGTAVDPETLAAVRARTAPESILAVDATSCLGGIRLDMRLADVWFASVQKCLGLPAGLAVMCLSPKALKRVQTLGEDSHYNSLSRVLSQGELDQSHNTPNVLCIYLLCHTQKAVGPVAAIDNRVRSRHERYIGALRDHSSLRVAPADHRLRSWTVIMVRTQDKTKLLARASKAGFILGSGYGGWGDDHVRISNFPAIQEKEVSGLVDFLKSYS